MPARIVGVKSYTKHTQLRAVFLRGRVDTLPPLPKNSDKRRRARLRCAFLCAALTLGTYADGYVFFVLERETFRSVIGTSEDAIHWPESRFPVQFRMLENALLPPDLEITHQTWTEIVERSLQRWTAIPTSSVELTLEGPSVAADQIDIRDGINTIGFTSDDYFRDSWVTASANWGFDDEGLTYCDIQVSPYFVKNWPPQDSERLLEIVITHEIGHCLGLLHTEPHPMPLWTDLPVAKDAAFLPDPVMSYSNSYGLDLPDDDTVAVSLLYPAPAFLDSRGSVSGTAILEGNPAAYTYVQAIQPGGSDAGGGPGPGVFADENGEFVVEGLLPGDWMLWVHPILVTRRNAHGNRTTGAAEADALDFLDQWSWVRVQAGEVLEDVVIAVRRGREISP